MLTGIVTRKDSVWQGHPDVAWFNDELFVTYRESDSHMARGHTQVCLVRDNKKRKYSEPRIIAKSSHRFNCPRLSVIGDTLWLICDEVIIAGDGTFFKLENDESKTTTFLWKTKDGDKWEGPIKTNIKGIVPDRICSTDDGFVIATHTKAYFGEPPRNGGFLVQNIWHATDLEGEWIKHPLCHVSFLNLCEASVSRLEDNTYIALMRENSGVGLSAFVCFSKDAISWSDPIENRMFGCHRPVTGQLKSGNLLTTYREASGSFLPGLWAKNTFACLTMKSSIHDGMIKSIILPLDHDCAKKSDSGYTGWVQLPDESIFIVNYITQDAPRPFIKWYTISETDF